MARARANVSGSSDSRTTGGVLDVGDGVLVDAPGGSPAVFPGEGSERGASNSP